MRPQSQQPRSLFAGDRTNIQRENSFHSPSKKPRPRREILPRFALPGELDTPLWETLCRPHECDESDYAYSCRALHQCARIPECGGRQGCRTCIGVRDQFHKWLRQWSREEVEVCPRSRAAPLPPACVLLCSPPFLSPAAAFLARQRSLSRF